MRSFYFVFTGILMICATAQGVDVELSDGTKTSGSIADIKSTSFEIKTPGGIRGIPFETVQRVTFGGEAVKEFPHHEIRLQDGSRFRAKNVRFQGETLEVELATSDNLEKAVAFDGKDIKADFKISLDRVSYVLRNAHKENSKAGMAKMLTHKSNFDRLLFATENSLDGVEGTLQNFNSEKGTFDLVRENQNAGESFRLGRSAGMIFNRPLPPGGIDYRCKVVDRIGNEVSVKEIQFTDGKYELKPFFGFAYPRRNEAELLQIDFGNGQMFALSDLKGEVKSDGDSESNPLPPVINNRNFDGRAIKLAVDNGVERTFSKGLTARVGTRITYALDGKYILFRTVIGVDTSVSTSGKGEVFILADGKEIGKVAFEQGKPATVFDSAAARADLKGVKELVLVVVSASPEAIGQQVSFGNPHLLVDGANGRR